MKDLLNKLSAIPAVSSHEEELRCFLKETLSPIVDEMKEDGLGNLIVFKKGQRIPKKKVLLDVHMDENGVMVSGYTDEGFLRFQTVGAVDRRTLIGKRVLLGDKSLPGVVGMKPIHLSNADERKSVPKTDDLYIDIGAKDKKQAESLLELGDVGWFDVESAPFGQDLWKGRSLDSKLPCAMAVRLLQGELPVNLTVVFSAMELVGTRGAYGAAFSQRPDLVLCLDAVPADDGPLSEQPQIALKKGAVLPVSDRFTQYDGEGFRQLRSIAENNAIPWQLQAKTSVTGNARAYQRSRCGAKTVGIALPVRYLHSPVQVVSLSDAENAYQLLLACLKES